MSNAKVISELLERGKQSGKLSTKEITDAIEEMDIDAEQINKLYDDLEANNIEIVDDIAPDDLNNALDFPVQQHGLSLVRHLVEQTRRLCSRQRPPCFSIGFGWSNNPQTVTESTEAFFGRGVFLQWVYTFFRNES